MPNAEDRPNVPPEADETTPSQPQDSAWIDTTTNDRAVAGKSAASWMSSKLLLPTAALVVAVAALLAAILERPGVPGDGLDAYDFSDPKAAVRSLMEVDVNADTLAMVELMRLRSLDNNEDAAATLESLKVNSVHTYKNMAAVLYETDDADERPQRQIRWFKNTDGVYHPASEPDSLYGWRREDPDSVEGRIYRAVMEWDAIQGPASLRSASPATRPAPDVTPELPRPGPQIELLTEPTSMPSVDLRDLTPTLLPPAPR